MEKILLRQIFDTLQTWSISKISVLQCFFRFTVFSNKLNDLVDFPSWLLSQKFPSFLKNVLFSEGGPESRCFKNIQ